MVMSSTSRYYSMAILTMAILTMATSRISASSKVAPKTSCRAAEGLGRGCSLLSISANLESLMKRHSHAHTCHGA